MDKTLNAEERGHETRGNLAVAAVALAEDRTAPAERSAPSSRQQQRSRRKRAVRARTISIQRMARRAEPLEHRWDDQGEERPRTRAECAEGPRPCPFVSCKHHLYIDVSPRTGSIKLNFPDLEVWEMGLSCALDVADQGGTTLENVGTIMNLTRERIRQVEVKALAQLQALRDMRELREADGYSVPRSGTDD